MSSYWLVLNRVYGLQTVSHVAIFYPTLLTIVHLTFSLVSSSPPPSQNQGTELEFLNDLWGLGIE
jgi:hypothetical protein